MTEQNGLTYLDEMLHITLLEGQARVLLCRATQAARRAARIHRPSDTACAALSRLLTATLMLSASLKGEKDSVTVTVDGGGPVGKLTAVAHGGAVKATAQYPQAEVPPRADGHLNVGALVGKNGRLCVIKDMGMGEPYIGQVNLVSGELGEDFAQYFTASEQTPSLVALGALVYHGEPLSAGGVLIQAMPGCEEKTLAELELRSMLFSDVSRSLADASLDELAAGWFDGLDMKIISREPVSFRCDCSREKMERALIALGKDELKDMIEQDGKATLTCHFCRSEQVFSKEELTRMMDQA